MKIVVTGTRGIPGIQGGIETHCEELYPRIVDDVHKVIVVRRPQFKAAGYDVPNYEGVEIKDLKTISGKYFEAFTHTLHAVCYAKSIGADIVHIHAIGPSLITPVVKLLGMKAVITHHGPDYDRQKWGNFSKRILKLGEKWGVKYADNVIVISKHIESLIQNKYGVKDKMHLIHNGVKLSSAASDEFVHQMNLTPGKYILAVGRFVEEKGFDLLIQAYANCKKHDMKLVIAGDADHPDHYSEKLKEMAKQNDVVLTGFIQKDQLAQLYANAFLFVLPSYHEGLPISLLEAMNCNCNVLVSDIPANVEVGLNETDYFKCGDVVDLTNHLNDKLEGNKILCHYDMRKYDWDYIAMQTKKIYDSLLKKTI